MKKLLTNILLFIVALILLSILASFWLFSGIFIILTTNPKKTIGRLSNYFKNLAIGIDQFWNILLWPFMNSLFIINRWFRFWDPDDTISYVLWVNEYLWTLRRGWKLLVKILWFIEKDHCKKAFIAGK